MRALPPIPITPAILTSTTCAEPTAGEAVWAAATSYKGGDRVISTTAHRTYESTASKSAPVMITIGTGVITWPSHGLLANTPITFSTTGALPTGLTIGTTYYVLADTANTFKVSATSGGSAVGLNGTQSGAHTALVSVNLGHDPATDTAGWWIDVGPTNRWAMFDLLRSTGTTIASPLTVTLTPGQRVDSIGVVGMVADTVTITVTVAGATVYTDSANLLNRPTGGWYDYFFGAFRYRQEFARFDLPPYTNAVITITLTKANGNVTCGGVVLGSSVYLGRTQHDAESDALNFSKIDRDDFGTATLVPRRSVPRTVQTLRCKKTDVDRILQLRDDLNAVPALWSGLDDQDSGYFSALLIVGVYKRFTISMDQPEDALISLELEEV
jgi:hypothetical protein